MEVTVGLPSRQGQVGGTCECFIVDLAAANGSRATRFVMDNCDGVRPPGCDEALYVASDRLTVALHGYVSPGVILLTVVTNGRSRSMLVSAIGYRVGAEHMLMFCN
jgi:hypothetical protein